MKKYWVIIMVLTLTGIVSCNKVRRNPGRVYMPDMAYSRAYETYASTEALQKKGIHYTAQPVKGTFSIDDSLKSYTLPADTSGSYMRSASFVNPLPADRTDMVEAERLYLVNCGICHGAKLDGNGPLWNDGNGPYPAAPRNFKTPEMIGLADGTYFHSISYGKGQMGGYASQMSPVQRWMVIAYIRSKQGSVSRSDSTAKVSPSDTTTKKVN